MVVLCILIQVLLHTYTNHDAEKLYGAGTQTYHRISVFFTEKKGQSEKDIVQIRNRILDKLYRETGNAREKVARMVYDTYSAQIKLPIERNDRYYEVDARAVGSNYFAFHKMEFVEGNAFLEDVTGADTVVISEALAYKLFGSTDVIGKILMSEGDLLVVCGVVKDEKDKNDGKSKRLEKELWKIYIPYKKAVEVLGEAPITDYEVITVESMQGYAKKLLEEAIGIDAYAEENSIDKYGVEIIDQSSRFKVSENIKRMFSFDKSAKKIKAMTYPEWEVKLRTVERIVKYLYFGILFCLILLFIDGCRLIRELKKRKTEGNLPTFKSIKINAMKKINNLYRSIAKVFGVTVGELFTFTDES